MGRRAKSLIFLDGGFPKGTIAAIGAGAALVVGAAILLATMQNDAIARLTLKYAENPVNIQEFDRYVRFSQSHSETKSRSR